MTGSDKGKTRRIFAPGSIAKTVTPILPCAVRRWMAMDPLGALRAALFDTAPAGLGFDFADMRRRRETRGENRALLARYMPEYHPWPFRISVSAQER